MVARSQRRDTGRRVGLEPRVIGEAALRLIDAHGTEALTMRRLADRLDVTPMALYNHVEGRMGVERLIVDAVVAEITDPPAPDDTDDDLRQIARHLRDLYLRHPNAMTLVQTVAPTGSAGLALIERALRKLTSCGHDIEQSRRIWVGLASLVNGHVAYELQGHFSDATTADKLPEDLPLLRQAIEIGPLDAETNFNFAVRAFLAGIDTNPT